MSHDYEYTWRPTPPVPPSAPPPRRPAPAPASALGPVILVAATALVTALLVLGGQRLLDLFSGRPPAEPRPVTARGELAGDEKATIELYNQARQSVVHITTLTTRRDINFNVQQVPEGTGSGF